MSGLIIKPRKSDWHQNDAKISFRAVTSGDWRIHQWFDENQRNPNFDNDGCTCYYAQKQLDAQMDAIWPTLPGIVQQWLNDNGYLDTGRDGQLHFHSSPRWVEILTGNRMNGNSLPEVLDVFRKYGTVPWKDLPFTPTMTPDEYFAPIPQPIIEKGLQFLNLMGGKDFCQYHWLNDGEPKNTANMQAMMLQAPLGVGIAIATNWNVKTPYPDPNPSDPPEHAIMVDYMDAPATEVCDNYIPYEKILDAGYPINYCIQAVIRYIPPPPAPQPSQSSSFSQWLGSVSGWLRNILERFTPEGNARLQGAKRSSKWPAVEKAFLKLNPVCKVCGTKNNLNVHHVSPFHLDPARELDPTNLITLCRPHHLLFGHLMAWASINTQVRSDAATWNGKIEERSK